jgi:hypothetical protein
MTSRLRKILPEFIYYRLQLLENYFELKNWKNKEIKVPVPHIVKQKLIESYKKKYSISVLIETGTYMGDMIKSQLNNFTILYSIELSQELWQEAVKRFKKYKHVTLLQGDSGEVLIELMSKIQNRAIFWLDGHYSAGITAKGKKECPIYEELDAIFGSNIDHILLIDDARLFIGEKDYPTIEELSKYILKYRNKSTIKIQDDVICVELNSVK